MRVATTRAATGARWLVAALLLASAAAPSYAVQPDEILPDARLEARARDLSHQLRCMVCQNQSIDESDAPLAHDLRVLVRERLKAGDSDSQVVDFLVARYGEFVLLKPRFEWTTAPLWLAPVALLLLGAATLWAALRRRRGSGGTGPDGAVPLSEHERARLAELTGANRP
ncbi:MAG TPA: cytochrome c-type biogenesis protein [Xanthobacteraceae bacterium]|jgi:cytochrome c-type biogenesis protein CcmH|nr:cytochrome c-type biogenesis protein [Xanthobacteraceae bacterium]